jgi:hypothetical protein
MANDGILRAKVVMVQRFKLHSTKRIIQKRRFCCTEMNEFSVMQHVTAGSLSSVTGGLLSLLRGAGKLAT